MSEAEPVHQSPASPPDLSNNDVVKVILLGDSAVGKSKLVERFLMDGYKPQQLSTYALTLYRYVDDVDGKQVPVDFWDTAGQERFNSMHPSYYYRANACIMVFDVTRKVTYKNLETWYKELQDFCKGIPTLVVANKIDLDTKVTQKTFNFATKRNLPLYFVSASDGTNVVKIFKEAVRLGIKYKEMPPQDFYQEVLSLLSDSTLGNKASGEAGDYGDEDKDSLRPKSSGTAGTGSRGPSPRP
eukprot:tig00020875_g14889.t1